MATLPRITINKSVLLSLEPLTPSSFAPFGTVITSPIAQSLSRVPSSPPQAEYHAHQPQPQFANQQTALKTSPISPLENKYPSPDPEMHRGKAYGLMSIFSCFPRQNVYRDSNSGEHRLKLEILERHPFTTQTFCPFNSSELFSNADSKSRTVFLVIVAPTITDVSASPPNPPDLAAIRAFVSPGIADGSPGMAVTYNAGTWHAPMVVLGERRVDFVVTQFANGRADDDCQEVLVGSAGKGGHNQGNIEVNLKVLGIAFDYGCSQAKL